MLKEVQLCKSKSVSHNNMTSRLPWCKNGVVQKVFKDFSVGSISSLSLQVLNRFGTGAAGALVWTLRVRLSGFGVLFLVSYSYGSNPNGDL